VYIPTVGCMNLAATVNVVLYDRLAKSLRQAKD
jgi:tRNA(Leu) C34 or U34 (ribose-2'-O)-methylase TrmL